MSIPTNTTPTSVFAPTARTTPRASCPAATDLLVLANGTRLRFRPISSDDRDRLARLFARLNPESRYRRFLSPKRPLTPQELVYLTDIDHVTHEAIAAVDQREGSIVGVGRYAQFADRVAVADVAFTVADALQGMGIGPCSPGAWWTTPANGFTLLTATTLWENRPARALLRRLRFRARASHGPEIELELELNPNACRVADHTMRSEVIA
jgi:RimJ/RimL family protein N-acetyltransferase